MFASLSTVVLILIAVVTLAATAIALSLRNIIRAALLLVVSWVGIAAFYLWADAQFVAFAQVLIYVGAISMIILFGVVLTRRAPVEVTNSSASPRTLRAATGILTGVLVAMVVVWGIITTSLPQDFQNASAPTVTMHDLGNQLMGQYAAAFLIVGALLTAALLGAVLLAAQESSDLVKNGECEMTNDQSGSASR